MIANIGDEVIRELSTRVKVSEVTENVSPSEFLRRRSRGVKVVIVIVVEVEGVFE